jgi:hypothetical protein
MAPSRLPPEQFQEKWKPLFPPELRPINELERIIDSTNDEPL